MKSGDIIYDSELFRKVNRLEAQAIILACLDLFADEYITNRVSNGETIDRLLQLCDLIIVDENQINKLKKSLEDESEVRVFDYY